MVGNLYLGLLNILAASILYNTQSQNQFLHKETNRKAKCLPEKKKNPKKKCRGKKINCCQKEVVELLKNLRKKDCRVKIFLSTGSTYCNLEGFIKDIRKKGSLLLLLNTKTNAQWFIPVDKIVTVCISY